MGVSARSDPVSRTADLRHCGASIRASLKIVRRLNYLSCMSSEHTGGASSGGHDHSAMFAANERALRISLWLTGIYFFVELGLGVASGSVAMLSDAMHTFSAVGGVLLALVANRIAVKEEKMKAGLKKSQMEIGKDRLLNKWPQAGSA